MAPTRISPSYEPNDDAPQLDNGFTSGELVPDFGSGDMGPLLQQPSDDVPPGGGLSGTRRVRSSRSSTVGVVAGGVSSALGSVMGLFRPRTAINAVTPADGVKWVNLMRLVNISRLFTVCIRPAGGRGRRRVRFGGGASGRALLMQANGGAACDTGRVRSGRHLVWPTYEGVDHTCYCLLLVNDQPRGSTQAVAVSGATGGGGGAFGGSAAAANNTVQWNEVFSFPRACLEGRAGSVVQLQVWSSESYGDDVLVGAAELPLGPLLAAERPRPLNTVLELQAIDDETGQPEPGSCGDLLVAAWVEPAAEKGVSAAPCMLSPPAAATDVDEPGVVTSNLSAPCGTKSMPQVIHSQMGTLYEEPCVMAIKISVVGLVDLNYEQLVSSAAQGPFEAHGMSRAPPEMQHGLKRFLFRHQGHLRLRREQKMLRDKTLGHGGVLPNSKPSMFVFTMARPLPNSPVALALYATPNARPALDQPRPPSPSPPPSMYGNPAAAAAAVWWGGCAVRLVVQIADLDERAALFRLPLVTDPSQLMSEAGGASGVDVDVADWFVSGHVAAGPVSGQAYGVAGHQPGPLASLKVHGGAGLGPGDVLTPGGHRAQLPGGADLAAMGRNTARAATGAALAAPRALGSLVLRITSLNSSGAVPGSSCCCIVKCGPHWLRTADRAPADGAGNLPQWQVVMPLYSPATILTVGIFSNSVKTVMGLTFSDSLTLVSRVRFKLGRVRPFKRNWHVIAMYMNGAVGGGSGSGASPLVGVLGVKVNYASPAALSAAYLAPALPDSLYELELDGDTGLKMEADARKIAEGWLSSAQPPIPGDVARILLDDGRSTFDFGRTKTNWRRVKAGMRLLYSLAAWFKHICTWSSSRDSWEVMLCIALLCYLPSTAMQSDSDEELGEDSKVAVGTVAEFKRKFAELIELGLMLQNLFDDVASVLERLQAVLAFQDFVASWLCIAGCLLLVAVVALLGFRTTVFLVLLWQVRPPALRDPLPPAPFNYFMKLPCKSAAEYG
eukprot:XP_001699188.1 predicted protein [Chlamydomonas reinhardtii]